MKKPIYFTNTISAYKNAPDVVSLGFAQSVLLTSWALFRNVPGSGYDTDHIDMDAVRKAASNTTWWEKYRGQMIVIDEESLPWYTDDRPQRDHIHDQLIEAVQIVRQYHPGVAIGYYMRMPNRDYWIAIGSKKAKAYKEWQERNTQTLSNLDDMSLTETRLGVAKQVDRVFPSLYSFYDMPANMAAWKLYADRNIEQALIYQKPIIPYLCPNQQQPGYPQYAAGIFKEQVEHVLSNPAVDGVTIFPIITPNEQFDENWDWWKELIAIKDEMKQI